MGRVTRNFRQTKGSGKTDYPAKTYDKINRSQGLGRFFNIFRKGDKSNG